ncbi:MAG: hypothetical protein AAGH45_05255, partial [Pseudomonadota bacterium]
TGSAAELLIELHAAKIALLTELAQIKLVEALIEAEMANLIEQFEMEAALMMLEAEDYSSFDSFVEGGYVCEPIETADPYAPADPYSPADPYASADPAAPAEPVAPVAPVEPVAQPEVQETVWNSDSASAYPSADDFDAELKQERVEDTLATAEYHRNEQAQATEAGDYATALEHARDAETALYDAKSEGAEVTAEYDDTVSDVNDLDFASWNAEIAEENAIDAVAYAEEGMMDEAEIYADASAAAQSTADDQAFDSTLSDGYPTMDTSTDYASSSYDSSSFGSLDSSDTYDSTDSYDSGDV